MCEPRNSCFFRPWNADEATEETARVNSASPQEDLEARLRLSLVKEEEHGSSFASYSTFEETSAESYLEAEAISSHPTGRRIRRRSESSTETSSRSGSVNSEDGNRNRNPDLLGNFVVESSNVPTITVPQFSRGTVSIPVRFPVEGSFSTSRSSHTLGHYQSFSLPHTSRLEPLYSGPAATHDGASALSVSTLATTGQPFYYGPPTIHHLSQGTFAPTMEQAVEMLHRQDAVAKQMKKLRPKKFKCEHCNVAFSNNGQLKGHVRIHTGERPFKCDAADCGKTFTRNEELTRHKRIHTGIRPHPCIVCGKRFGRKDHLKKHMKTHENRDPYGMSAAALGMFALGQTLPPGHPFPPYVYPM